MTGKITLLDFSGQDCIRSKLFQTQASFSNSVLWRNLVIIRLSATDVLTTNYRFDEKHVTGWNGHPTHVIHHRIYNKINEYESYIYIPCLLVRKPIRPRNRTMLPKYSLCPSRTLEIRWRALGQDIDQPYMYGRSQLWATSTIRRSVRSFVGDLVLQDILLSRA